MSTDDAKVGIFVRVGGFTRKENEKITEVERLFTPLIDFRPICTLIADEGRRCVQFRLSIKTSWQPTAKEFLERPASYVAQEMSARLSKESGNEDAKAQGRE